MISSTHGQGACRVRSNSTFFAMTLTAMLMFATGVGPVFAAPGATDPIVVVAVHGEVSVSTGGATLTVRPGSVIDPPATILTGRDGHVELRQGATTASIAGDTRVELPALAGADGLIERVRQPRGNVVYDVARRPGRKLRIETPYLVAVVKGTRFNVAAQYESATVSLFEGRLEIWAPDESDVVDINAGEIATRSRTDRRIRVLSMDTGDLIRARNAAPGEATDTRSAGAATRDAGAEPPPVVAIDEEHRDTRTTTESPATVEPNAQVAAGAPDLTTVDVDDVKTGADIDAFTKVGPVSDRLDVPVAVDLDAGELVLAPEAALGVSETVAVRVATENPIDLTSPSLDPAAAVDVDLGTAVTTGTTATAVIEPTGAQTDIGAQAGVVSTPIAVDAGVGVGSTTAIDAGVAAGPLTVDVGVGVDAGTGAPTVDPGVPVAEPAQPDAPLPAIVEVVVAPLRGLLGP
jgi:FecR protein